jgi:signal transduction histidine kinase
MGLLIDSLLQLSRVTRSDLTREDVNLSELAEEIARDIRAQSPGRNLIFRIEPGMKVNADPRLLRVALENLLGNAAKFTSKLHEAIVEVARDPHNGEFYVRDNGAGFDMKYNKKLFTAFQRLHGERDFSGSGIGLATVYRVIRRHQGAIHAEGAVGAGATFWFTLG